MDARLVKALDTNHIFKAIVQVWKRASLETCEEARLCLMRKALMMSLRQTLEDGRKRPREERVAGRGSSYIDIVKHPQLGGL